MLLASFWSQIQVTASIRGLHLPRSTVPPRLHRFSFESFGWDREIDKTKIEQNRVCPASASGKAQRWEELVPDGARPPARTGHATAVDSKSRSMVIFGGPRPSFCVSCTATDSVVSHSPLSSSDRDCSHGGLPRVLSPYKYHAEPAQVPRQKGLLLGDRACSRTCGPSTWRCSGIPFWVLFLMYALMFHIEEDSS